VKQTVVSPIAVLSNLPLDAHAVCFLKPFAKLFSSVYFLCNSS